ncbi:partitioning defective 3 homolog isoform X1 [Chelonus insularis]|uniref:partitioning defective 3 homolog isoform X1 n=1 Tax=Chelonus insularis TaxID=460826 RepID=UPI00158E0AAE|nr:partitioning defective 3 homolog isoform X1 [Chelonus insularis]XP_034952761.1 partitioning defective 3 homolog isoform X1 [Chelonus insularis]
MKVTVCFDNIRVVVPCGDGSLLVRDLMREAIIRYRKATGKTEPGPVINSLSSLTGGGLLDPDDRLCDVADDREQIIAHINNSEVIHIGGDGASSVGTNSPDYFQPDDKDNRYGIDTQNKINNNIKRESVKRLSMHALSTRELVGPSLPTYSALSLPRESRRREPLGQDAKATYELTSKHPDLCDQNDIQHIIIKNEPGPLGLHVVPCYDLLGNDQGLRVEGIEPNGRIAKDGQIDLHDKIIRINGHNLLKIPFTKVQEIFRTCMNEPCLKISIIKHKKLSKKSTKASDDKLDQPEDNIKKLQCANYNLLQNANTRKIGRMIEIELTKGTNGLGFSVTTRDNPAGGHCPIYIKNILPKGAAVEDGRLKSGDRLLEVNKIEMTGKSQAEVVSLLRSIPPGGKVRMIVSRQEEVSTSSLETPSIPVTATNTSHVSEANSWSSPSVSPVKASEEFDNGKNYDKNYKQLGDDVMLSPRKNRIILTFDIPVHDSEKAGLGVSVKGKTTSADENTNMDLGIFIKSVIHGGAASRDGRLKTNDQLLNVNGVSLLGLSNSDAMETLRRAMLNTNSVVSGVITLTIARRVSAYDSDKNNRNDGIASCKLESANSIFISDNKSDGSGVSRVMEKNNLNNQESLDDSLLSSTSVSPWNPVIERLTEQYNKNSIRNESYCLATNKTWIDSVSNAKKIMNRDNDLVLLEESIPDNVHDVKKNVDDKESQYSGDPSYDSQLSLEEFSSGNQFSRDALGRQSMSEKRHAALDAKNTDTYKRNKKLREGRENKSHGNKTETEESKSNISKDEEQVTKKCGESQFEVTRRRFEKKSDSGHSDYVYTIPGCNNKISPKKHWLVDDNPVDVGNNNQCKDEPEGFSHSRGDVKQASLNSALDKRSRKKGLKSMLRLGKNRKSLNFGDNLDARHESSNYCSGTINYIA